jgi:dTDP-4-amino-4,6-dideoxygalactose transaminase
VSSPSSERAVKQIPLFRVNLPPEDELMPALRDVLYSGQISEGEPVAEFERRFAALVQAPHVRSIYSGTAALHVALLCAGVQPGDDVVSTAMTAEPTNMAIRHAGANVVWADVDPANGNLSADAVAEAVTARTRAILAVHYGGIPAPIDGIGAVAAAHGIPVVEDAAQALGARYHGAPLGRHSRFVVFSLQAIKHMTTVDGGMIAFQDAQDAERARLLRWFGIDRHASRTEVDVADVGFKYHMNNVTATIGLAALPGIQRVIDRHVANGRHFDAALAGLDGVELCRWEPHAEPSYWFYTLLVDRRDDFVAHLADRGIAASTVHRRNDLHSVFASSRRALPGLDAFAARMVHIPCGWWLTEEDRERIVEAVAEGW